MFNITYTVGGTESRPVKWKTVPHVGDYIELNSESGSQEHKVLKVVHIFRRGVDSQDGEISIYLEKSD